MKGITKDIIKQDFDIIQQMAQRYNDAIYENQEGQLAHFDNQSKLCKLAIGDVRCGLHILTGALDMLNKIEIIED